MDLNRAYSAIEVKEVSESAHTIRGIATSPRPDRLGDVVEPDGVKVADSIPLFLHHDSQLIVGRAKLGKATSKGIPFEATLPEVKEPGKLKDRVDEAWQSVKYGLITGVSIGFRPVNDAIESIKGGGLRFVETEILELSLVPVPAQPDAVIQGFKRMDAASQDIILKQIKSADQATRRAAHGAKGVLTNQRPAGNGYPDASGFPQSRIGVAMKTLQQLIEERTTKSARMSELIELRSAENRKFATEEAAEFDTLDTEVSDLDDEIRIKRFEERQAKAATPVKGLTTEQSQVSRGGISFVRKQDPDDTFKGQAFTRILTAKALALQYGDSPAYIAEKRWGKTNPMLVNVIKAAVAGGGTGSGEWGAELAQADTRYTGDFIEFLYAKTVFDQLDLRQVPARVSVKGQDGAFTGYWRGESKAIPASKGDFSTVDLSPLNVSALAVISMELLEDSQPSAERLVRDGLAEASAQRIDQTFLSASAASAGVSPAGILNGVSAITPSGTDLAATRADLTSLMYPFVSNKMATGIVLVMNPATALALSMMYGSLDQQAYPDLNEMGGTLNKRRVIVGDNVTPGDVIAIRPQDVWRIGDTGIRVSMSREATIEQQDDPTGATDTPTGMTTTNMTNMFQEESIAFKVVRRINFQKRRTAAVQYLSNVEWGGVAS